VRFALAGAAGAAGAELVAEDVVLEPRACRFTIVEAHGRTHVTLQLPGRHNVENALAAWGATIAFGIDRTVAARALASFGGVPGRLELIDRGQPFTVLVDYAHTPDALTRVISTVRETLPASARLAVVFGCGGDRDRGKRAAMGEAVARGADLAVVTDDNPRNENPAVIRGEAIKGAEAAFAATLAPPAALKPMEIAGRRRAIEQALAWAKPGDVVLLAGKGHEGLQIVGASSVPFDDRLEATRALEALGYPA